MLIEYNADGSINDIKPIDNSIFSCNLSEQDILDIQGFSGYFYRTCSTPNTFPVQYFYDVYVQNLDGSYAEVPLSVGPTYYKRFTPTLYKNLQISLTSVPPLQVPLITLANDTAKVSCSSHSAGQSLNYTAFLAVFMVGMMIIFAISFYRYMKYNPDENNDPYYCFKAIFLFFVYIIKYLAVAVHLFLVCFTGYVFCFYKFQRTIYLSLLDVNSDTTGLYQIFFALFYVNFSFLFIAVLIQIFNMTNTTDYFLIDWEKEK